MPRKKSDHALTLPILSAACCPQSRGANLKGLCPFHKEKTPSFTVTPAKGIFYCFGCHKGGDVFTFLMEFEGLSFSEALHMLADEAGRDSCTAPLSKHLSVR